MKNKGEIIFYRPEESLELEVRMEDETVWLTIDQMAILFGKSRSTINEHILNVYNERELVEYETKRKIGNSDFSTKPTNFYNLDVIISVGYRVKSKRGTQFRIWATKVLKDYMLKGYVLNQRIDKIEQVLSEQGNMLANHDEKINLFIRTSLPPVEGIFFDGQLFDAYKFAADLIKSARKSIVLIDNYIDESVLMLFTKRLPGVAATIYTAHLSKQLLADLQHHNAQYEPVTIKEFRQSHDRFLLIDDKDIYHIGASLKDLGKKWFAFSKLNLEVKDIMQKIT